MLRHGPPELHSAYLPHHCTPPPAVLTYWALNEVARDLEDPYIYDPNDLPLARHQVRCGRATLGRREGGWGQCVSAPGAAAGRGAATEVKNPAPRSTPWLCGDEIYMVHWGSTPARHRGVAALAAPLVKPLRAPHAPLRSMTSTSACWRPPTRCCCRCSTAASEGAGGSCQPGSGRRPGRTGWGVWGSRRQRCGQLARCLKALSGALVREMRPSCCRSIMYSGGQAWWASVWQARCMPSLKLPSQ